MSNSQQLQSLLNAVIPLAIEAGKQVMQLYLNTNDKVITIKQDGSPLTLADQAADICIKTGLTKIAAEYPLLSEEGADIPYAERAWWDRYWLIDPLDGTREFLEYSGDFTINIALIEARNPILGVVYIPTTGVCYYAARDLGAFKRLPTGEELRLQTKPFAGQTAIVAASRHHGDAQILENFLVALNDYRLIQRGSSLKFCLVAEGLADIYPRFGITSEWDTAAAQCILEQAGGKVMDMHGLPLNYNMRASLQNPYFLAVADKQHNWLAYTHNKF